MMEKAVKIKSHICFNKSKLLQVFLGSHGFYGEDGNQVVKLGFIMKINTVFKTSRAKQ